MISHPSWRLSFLLASVFALILTSTAQTPAPAPNQTTAEESPHRLVAATIWNELHHDKTGNYWMYIDSDQTPGKTVIKRVVETPECWFSWPIKIDGQPVTAAQQAKQRAEVDKLVNDPQAQEKDRQEVNSDGQKAEQLLQIFPSAFLFTLEGQEGDVARVAFRPNPAFQPPTSAAKVFHAMQGTLLINTKEMRLVGISGTLMRDVTFGWGILGRIKKGGTFDVRQTEEAPGDWEVTMLNVHIHGKALFFHTINEQQHEVKTEFRPVPENITVAKAAALVENGGQAENASAAAGQTR